MSHPDSGLAPQVRRGLKEDAREELGAATAFAAEEPAGKE